MAEERVDCRTFWCKVKQFRETVGDVSFINPNAYVKQPPLPSLFMFVISPPAKPFHKPRITYENCGANK